MQRGKMGNAGEFKKWGEQRMCEIYNDDALNILPTIADSTVNAVITDPPYMLNMKSAINKKFSPWGDHINGSVWYAEWFKQARRVLKNDGCLWTFLNWRSLPTFQKASCDIGWPIESLMVWDKCCISTGTMRGLRPSYELVALFAMPDFKIDNRGLPDVQRFKWSTSKPNGHPAEKPVELMRWLIEISTKPGDRVADFFVGSGTTGEAALLSGRSFIGIEQDKEWCDYATKRLEETKNGR